MATGSQHVRYTQRLIPVTIPAGLLSFLTGLVVSRLLYETQFPSLQILGSWPGALGLALPGGVLGMLLARWLRQRHAAWQVLLPFLPLAISAPYLVMPNVQLLAGPWLVWFSLGSSLTVLVWLLASVAEDSLWPLLSLIVIVWLIFGQTMGRTVGRADTFEFQVRTLDLGIVHPTGYPLWLLLAKPFTWLPFGTAAWRVNLAAVTWGLVATILLFFLVRSLTGRSWAGWIAAIIWATRPTFWSQAIEAEVYTLHAVIVAGALWQMVWLAAHDDDGRVNGRFVWLTAWIGLGFTNHLTTVFLLPPAGYLLIRHWVRQTDKGATLRWLFPRLLTALVGPLILYAYLPWRWQVTNGEPMGLGRFIDWVIGGRFQDALQWSAWLNDPERWRIVGRLFLDEWGWLGIGLALAGGLLLGWKRQPAALVLLLTWAGFSLYCLNYLVPDLAVFLLPAQLVFAVVLGALPGWLRTVLGQRTEGWLSLTGAALLVILLGWFAVGVPTTWERVDRSNEDNFTEWGWQVLQLPLAEDATILADSEKIAPLNYLQEAEGLRPDLNIMVLPDEAAYLNELNSRLANDEVVYLARFLPRLEGIYHLRSVGPLTEVSKVPLDRLPAGIEPLDRQVGPLRLLGARPDLSLNNTSHGLTLFWQKNGPIEENLLIYSRWSADGFASLPEPLNGQHPANNFYPTLAWDEAEIVSDFQQLSWPHGLSVENLTFQVAVAPAFSPANELTWVNVRDYPGPYFHSQAEADGEEPPAGVRPVRAQLDGATVTGIGLPATARLNREPTVLLGCLAGEELAVRWVNEAREASGQVGQVRCGPVDNVVRVTLPLPGENGVYELKVLGEGRCGWLRGTTSGCTLGQIEVIGAPVPEGATNFSDQIGLLSLTVPETTLSPGGQVVVEAAWQGLLPLENDYTVFVQVLDAGDQIVGQLDTWPLQGTFPTSQWVAGELVTDRYVVNLTPELAEGDYRLIIGWYLLGTPVQRLVVFDAAGNPIADKVEVTGLTVGGP